MIWLARIFFFFLAVYFSYGLVAWMFERALLYPADKTYAPPPAGFDEIRITCATGAETLSWLLLPTDPSAPVVLHFHGNGSSLNNQAYLYQQFVGEGWGVMGVTYPGYSGASGKPNERDNVACGLAAFDRLATDVSPGRIVLYGKSLGTGIAVQVAAQRKAAALVLDAPYSAVADVAAGRYYLPAHLVMRDKYMSREHIKKVQEPLLWLHGQADQVIPVRFGQRLYDAANEPKVFRVFKAGSHYNLYGLGALDTLRAFVEANTD